MSLISLLLALSIVRGSEYAPGGMVRFCSLAWFDRYHHALEVRLSGRAWWDGKAGLVFTLAVPLLLLILAGYLLAHLHVAVAYLLGLIVLVYSIGPDMNGLFRQYVQAMGSHDNTAEIDIRTDIEARLLIARGEADQRTVLAAFICYAHVRLFGVIFWFVVLDAVGALLFCLTVRLLEKYRDIHGHYAAAVCELYSILAWPSARLLALACAVAGSLPDALAGWARAWDESRNDSLSAGEAIIEQSALGALQYPPAVYTDDAADERADDADGRKPFADWLLETRALLNRSLIVWLTTLGLVTIPGWLP